MFPNQMDRSYRIFDIDKIRKRKVAGEIACMDLVVHDVESI